MKIAYDNSMCFNTQRFGVTTVGASAAPRVGTEAPVTLTAANADWCRYASLVTHVSRVPLPSGM